KHTGDDKGFILEYIAFFLLALFDLKPQSGFFEALNLPDVFRISEEVVYALGDFLAYLRGSKQFVNSCVAEGINIVKMTSHLSGHRLANIPDADSKQYALERGFL